LAGEFGFGSQSNDCEQAQGTDVTRRAMGGAAGCMRKGLDIGWGHVVVVFGGGWVSGTWIEVRMAEIS
jgi:hypothetical protein